MANCSCRCRHRAQSGRHSSESLRLTRQGVGVYGLGDNGFGYRLALLGTADERGGTHPCFFWWEEGKGAVGGVPWVAAEEGKLGLRPGIGSCSSDGGDLNEVECYRRRTQMTIRGHWVLRSSAPSTR